MAAGALAAGPLGVALGTMVAALAGASIPAPTSAAWTLCAGPTAGARGAYTAPVMASGTAVGRAAPMHDGQWFERIHVVPRAYDLGQLVANRTLPLEVWNAHRRSFRLFDVVATGDDAVWYDGVIPPIHCPYFRSFDLDVLVYAIGTGPLEATLTFVFQVRTGASTYVAFPTPGADVTVTAQRTPLFTARPNAAARVRERYGYLTNVISAWDGTEQRVQLTERPRRELAFRPTLVSAAEAFELMAKLYATGVQPFAVPVWPDASPLTADVTFGDSLVYVDTAGRAFVAGGTALLWRDQWTAEAVPVAEVHADHLVLADQVVGSFAAAGTVCVPLEAMRLLEAPSLERQGGSVAEVEVAFSGELVA